MHRLFFALIVSLFTMSAIATPATAAPIIETVYSRVVTASGKAQTSRQVETAISSASAHRGWKFERVGPGKLLGTLIVRGKHYVAIDVVYNSKEYTITYKDSKNMRYDAATKTIHKRYNSWIENLDNDIKFYFQSK